MRHKPEHLLPSLPRRRVLQGRWAAWSVWQQGW